ncbi:MAG: helix-turn-helix domain-containing protein [Pseudonocardiaceae bacterium]
MHDDEPLRGYAVTLVARTTNEHYLQPQSKGQGRSLGQIAAKTGIPKTSLHRYLVPATTEG